MKKPLAALCSVFVLASAASAEDKPPQQQIPAAPAPAQNWTTTFSSEVRYFSWRNNLVPGDGTGPGKGSEIYVPVALQLTGKPVDTLSLDFVVRGGWVKAVQSTTGRSGEVQTATDTVVSTTATYLGIQGMQPFVSLNANLPSGKSALLGDATNARMDPDFVDISTFGEGYNLGPTLGFNFPITSSLLVTTSVGYTWRGRFERESDLSVFQAGTDPGLVENLISLNPTQTVNPGDNTTVTAAVNYQVGSFAIGLTGSATWETATKVNGLQTFKPGLRYLLALQSSYVWPENLGKTSLSASVAHSNRNQVKVPQLNEFELISEIFNSNSNIFRVGLEHLFPAGQFQIGPIGSVLYRDHNAYNAATLQFVPAKTRWSAGLLAQYAPTATVTINARVEGVWTHENENPIIPGENPDVSGGRIDALADGLIPASAIPAISGTGWQTSFGINIKL